MIYYIGKMNLESAIQKIDKVRGQRISSADLIERIKKESINNSALESIVINYNKSHRSLYQELENLKSWAQMEFIPVEKLEDDAKNWLSAVKGKIYGEIGLYALVPLMWSVLVFQSLPLKIATAALGVFSISRLLYNKNKLILEENKRGGKSELLKSQYQNEVMLQYAARKRFIESHYIEDMTVLKTEIKDHIKSINRLYPLVKNEEEKKKLEKENLVLLDFLNEQEEIIQIIDKNKEYPISPVLMHRVSLLDAYYDISMNGLKRRKEENDNKNHSFVDSLISAGIPEEAIRGNEELWDFIQRTEKNKVVSEHQNFHIQNKEGDKCLLKISNNETRAQLEAIANYYLSPHFEFIIPGQAPQPIECNGMYMTIQKEAEDVQPRSLDYWIASFAMFHREAERIFKEENIEIEEVTFRSAEEEIERYQRGKINNILNLKSKQKLEDAIAYLQETDYKFVVHNDAKPDNLFGPYLIDLELIGKGHPALDLSLLLVQYGVHKENYDVYLKQYLDIKGVKGSHEKELKELKEGMKHASYYKVVKEVIGSSLREVRPKTEKDNLGFVESLRA
jgi:hypothetical protein